MRIYNLLSLVLVVAGCNGLAANDDVIDPVVTAVGKADDESRRLIGRAERVFDELVFCTPGLDHGCIERASLPGSRSKARFDRLVKADGAEDVSLWGPLSVGGW
jgi:hypothetical protein